MADLSKVTEIIDAVSIPVMASTNGHFGARVLESLGVDMIDESEVLTIADENIILIRRSSPFHLYVGPGISVKFRDRRRCSHDWTKGEAGTGNVVEAVRHMRMIQGTIRELKDKTEEELWAVARQEEAQFYLVKETQKQGRIPVLNLAAGGVATPADAALMMQLGADGVFVGSGIFKSENPVVVAKAITEATAHLDDAEIIAEVSRDLGKAMPGLEISQIPESERLQDRGW